MNHMDKPITYCLFAGFIGAPPFIRHTGSFISGHLQGPGRVYSFWIGKVGPQRAAKYLTESIRA